MALTRAEIKKKPGYEPYKKDRSWQKDLVAIRVPDFPQDGEPEVVSVGIGGIHYHVPRSVDVKVPRLVKTNLETRIQHQWAIGGREQMTGMKYLGRLPRFHVIELSGERAENAREVRPAAPPTAEARVALAQAAIKSAQEDLAAREAVRSAPVHEALQD